ncbi:hypothetical protein SRDD_44330 [Serratia sp. DD3]|nr:hypothetical protein SRDD_44330 [Serratia sp. DD3]
MLFASAVPLKVGLASSVTLPLANGPRLSPTSSMALPITGCSGAVVSTFSTKAGEVTLLPAASSAVTVRLWLPSPRSVSGVKLQLPSCLTVVVPSSRSPSFTVITLPGLPLPFSSGRGSSVTSPGCRLPVTEPTLSFTEPSCTSTGESSTSNLISGLGSLTLPAGSVTVVFSLCSPLSSGSVGVKLHLPSSSILAVPISSPLS